MNILIIGLGSIAKKHITAIRAINNDFKRPEDQRFSGQLRMC